MGASFRFFVDTFALYTHSVIKPPNCQPGLGER